MQNQQKYGYGLEQECWISDLQTGNPVAELQGKSAYLVISNMWEEILGKKDDSISPELLSCQLEVKTPVLDSPQEAIEYIIDKIASINATIKHLGVQLETTGYKSMNGVQLIAADPNAASYRRVQEWSQTPAGQELLRSTAICSTQLNVSAGLETYGAMDRLAILGECYGYMTQNYESLEVMNQHSPRLGIIEKLIIAVKKDNFNKAGLIGGSTGRDETWITRPDGSHTLLWHMAHSGVVCPDDIQPDNIEEVLGNMSPEQSSKLLARMDSKDAHGLLLKGKLAMVPTSPLPMLNCIEQRWADARGDINACVQELDHVHAEMLNSAIGSALSARS